MSMTARLSIRRGNRAVIDRPYKRIAGTSVLILWYVGLQKVHGSRRIVLVQKGARQKTRQRIEQLSVLEEKSPEV